MIDYRAHAIDVNLEEHFIEKMSEWDKTNKYIANPVWRTNREKFAEVIEDKLNTINLELETESI